MNYFTYQNRIVFSLSLVVKLNGDFYFVHEFVPDSITDLFRIVIFGVANNFPLKKP